MFILHSYSSAVIFCIITMLCWGSWANAQKLSHKKWGFQLFYWDYTLGILILSIIGAFTLGSSGLEGRAFLADLHQASMSSYLNAFIGGIIFNLANILLVAAIDIAGMAVAFPVAIGLALVLGVAENYVAQPLGNGWLLSLGVLGVVIAIVIDALAYKRLQQNKSTAKGLIIALVSGVLMGTFYRFVAASMTTDFIHPDMGLFTPYSAVVVFAVGIVLSNFVWNTYMMYKPLSGEKVSYKEYFSGSVGTHSIGLLGGVIWGIGMLFNMIASGKAGFAISYGLGQGATMIAALWGVFVWREFSKAPKGTNRLLTWMFICYVIGLVLIIAARVV